MYSRTPHTRTAYSRRWWQNVHKSVALTHAAFGFTASAVTIVAATQIAIGPASFGFTGSAMAVDAGLRIPVGPAGLSYTGSSAHPKLSPHVGPTGWGFTGTSFSHSGAIAVNISPDRVTYDLLPFTISQGVFTAINPASFGLTGSVVAFDVGRVIPLGPAHFGFTGSSLLYSIRFHVDSGSFGFTGSSVLAGVGIVIPVAKAGFGFTGRDSGQKSNHVFALGSAHLGYSTGSLTKSINVDATRWEWSTGRLAVPPSISYRYMVCLKGLHSDYSYITSTRATHMPEAVDLPAIDAGTQDQTITFDFGGGNYIPAGTTLVGTPSVSMAVLYGTDPNPDSRITTDPVITTAQPPYGSGRASCAVAFQVGGCPGPLAYLVTCSCDVSNGDRAVMTSRLPVRVPPN